MWSRQSEVLMVLSTAFKIVPIIFSEMAVNFFTFGISSTLPQSYGSHDGSSIGYSVSLIWTKRQLFLNEFKVNQS